MARQSPSTSTAPGSTKLCSRIAARDAHDPVGSAPPAQLLLLVEVPTPWGAGFYEADPSGTPWRRLRSVMNDRLESRRNAGLPPQSPEGYRQLLGVAPDREWTVPDAIRAVVVSRPVQPFASFEMTEYAFPVDGDELVAVARQLMADDGDTSAADSYRLPEPPPRQFLVCTHGQVDTCCAAFGVPLHANLRGHADAGQAWRTTHFGGHRFAPTMLDLPSGYAWAFVEPPQAEAIAALDPATGPPLECVRGWMGTTGPAQVVDREGLRRYGWAWLDFPRSGEVLEQDEESARARARVTFYPDDGHARCIEGDVIVQRRLDDLGCGSSYGERDHLSPEFGLATVTEYDLSGPPPWTHRSLERTCRR